MAGFKDPDVRIVPFDALSPAGSPSACAVVAFVDPPEDPSKFLAPLASYRSFLLVDLAANDWPGLAARVRNARHAKICDGHLILSTKIAYTLEWTALLSAFLDDGFSFSTEILERFQIAAQELVTNAIIHGNLQVEIPAEKDADVFARVFSEVEDALSDAAHAQKPLFISLGIGPGRVDLSIEDQGPGFKFSHFVEKYNDQAFIKGLDYVLHTVDSFRKASHKGNVSIRLKEKGAEPEDTFDVQSQSVAIMSASKVLYNIINGHLTDLGYANIQRITADTPSLESLPASTAALIILSDIPFENVKDRLSRMRTASNKQVYPVLYQIDEKSGHEFDDDFFEYVNEILHSPVNFNEFASRLKVQLGMFQAKENLHEKLDFYLSELERVRPEVQRYEIFGSETIGGNGVRNDTQAPAKIHYYGSQTREIIADHIHTKKPEFSPEWYFQSFPTIADNPHFAAGIAFRETGMTPILLISRLAAEMRTRTDICDPDAAFAAIKTLASSILPAHIDRKVLVLGLSDAQDGHVCFWTSGPFSLFRIVTSDSGTTRITKEGVGIVPCANGAQRFKRPGLYLISPEDDFEEIFVDMEAAPGKDLPEKIHNALGLPFFALDVHFPEDGDLS